MALLATLMRHYQHRVYEPKLEVDETGAQLPSPSLPNITARRLYDEWLKRALAMNPALSFKQLDIAAGTMMQWTALVPDSASDAYAWEVERAVDKRVIKADYLASDEQAGAAFEVRVPQVAVGLAPSRFKVFLSGAQQGPYSHDELALRIARGEVGPDTKVWSMQWNPKADKWKLAGDMPELADLFGEPVPDPDNDIPDPD